VRCVVQIHSKGLELHPEIGNQLCLIAQEAVMNAVKHAEASIIILEARTDADGYLAIRVADNGKGLSDSEDHDGFGLTIMRERASLIGAFLEIGAGEQGGTVVTCRWREKCK
jgi:two-component system nitrate/nitrite sensor histidine kinase NarQ